MTDSGPGQLRRYLLGGSTEPDAAAIEAAYFADAAALDRLAAAEDDLIEDYLDNTLSVRDRDLFERVYLASPDHRRRVELIRRLTGAAARQPSPMTHALRRPVWRWSLALAATLVAAVGLTSMWRSIVRPAPLGEGVARTAPAGAAEPGRTAATPESRQPLPQQVFAMALSPISVRGAAETPPLVIPAGTDVVALELLADTPGRVNAGARAEVRTVDGAVIWQGPAAPPIADGRGIARVEIPADRLPVDDYVVSLIDRTRAGDSIERARYPLHVRAR